MIAAIHAFNEATQAMSLLSEAMVKAQEEFNQNIDENNLMVDAIEARDAQKVHDEANAKKLISAFESKIAQLCSTIESQSKNYEALQFRHNNTSLELRELKALDLKGLLASNKKLKKEKTSLTERLVASEAARKEALSQHKTMLKKRQDEGLVCVHSDPETGNQLKLIPSLRISRTNAYNGVPETPIIEFFHKASGIIRQGTLLNTGEMGWASAANSMPTKQESKIAKLKIVEFCEARKIKIEVSS